MKKAQMLGQGNYMTVIKPLSHEIGVSETIALMELIGLYEVKRQKQLDRIEFAKENGSSLDPNKLIFCFEDNAFRCLKDEFEMETTLTYKQQLRIFKKLEGLGLLKTVYKGLPSKRFIILYEDAIEDLNQKCCENFESFKKNFYVKRREKHESENKKRDEREAKKREQRKSEKEEKEKESPSLSAFTKGHINENPKDTSTRDEREQHDVTKGHVINNGLGNNGLEKNEINNNEYKDQDLDQTKPQTFQEAVSQNVLKELDLPMSIKKLIWDHNVQGHGHGRVPPLHGSLDVFELETFYHTSPHLDSKAGRHDYDHINNQTFSDIVKGILENKIQVERTTSALLRDWVLRKLGWKDTDQNGSVELRQSVEENREYLREQSQDPNSKIYDWLNDPAGIYGEKDPLGVYNNK